MQQMALQMSLDVHQGGTKTGRASRYLKLLVVVPLHFYTDCNLPSHMSYLSCITHVRVFGV